MPYNQHAREAIIRALSDSDHGLTAAATAAITETVLAELTHELEDARMFRWIADNATISWDMSYKNAQICFPLEADFFDTIEDAVRKAMGDKPEDDQ
jgi:hypothetical protein